MKGNWIESYDGRVYDKLAIERLCKKINELCSQSLINLEHNPPSSEEIVESVKGAIARIDYQTSPINVLDYAKFDFDPNIGVHLKINKTEHVSDEDWSISVNQFYNELYGRGSKAKKWQ